VNAGVLTPLPTVTLGRCAYHAISESTAADHILDELGKERGGWVVTPNLDYARRFPKDPEFLALCQDAALCLADGMPLIWASRLQRTPLPERVAGSSLISLLCGRAANRGRSVFLMGGSPGTAERAAEILCERNPALDLAGTFCPPLGFENDPAQIDACVQALLEAKPDIVFVALGSPKEEVFCRDLHHHLPNSWWLAVGISFSYLCGDVRPAPGWMKRCGLEWVHRLSQEPTRLAKRYLVHGIPFAIPFLLGSALRGLRRRDQVTS